MHTIAHATNTYSFLCTLNFQSSNPVNSTSNLSLKSNFCIHPYPTALAWTDRKARTGFWRCGVDCSQMLQISTSPEMMDTQEITATEWVKDEGLKEGSWEWGSGVASRKIEEEKVLIWWSERAGSQRWLQSFWFGWLGGWWLCGEKACLSWVYSFSKLSREIVNHKWRGQHSCVQCDWEEVCYAMREVAPGQQDELTAKHWLDIMIEASGKGTGS